MTSVPLQISKLNFIKVSASSFFGAMLILAPINNISVSLSYVHLQKKGMMHTLTAGETDENIDIVFNDVINWIEARI